MPSKNDKPRAERGRGETGEDGTLLAGWMFYQGFVGRGRCRRWMRWAVNGDVIWPDWRRGYGPAEKS